MTHEGRTNGGKSGDNRMDLLKPDMQPQRILQSEDIWDLVKTRSFSFRLVIHTTIRSTYNSFIITMNPISLLSSVKFPMLKLLLTNWKTTELLVTKKRSNRQKKVISLEFKRIKKNI